MRLVGAANASLGAYTAFDAERVARRAAGPDAVPDPRIVRVLGIRQLVQGLVTVAAPTRQVVLGGAAVDCLHAASMLPVPAVLPAFGRPARLSAASALLSAAAAYVAWRSAGH